MALYQTEKFHPGGVPMALVHDILAFSMEPPKILDQLDLWDEIRGWMPSVRRPAGGDEKISPKHLEVEDQPGAEAEEPGTPGRLSAFVKSLRAAFDFVGLCHVFFLPRRSKEVCLNISRHYDIASMFVWHFAI